MYKNYVPVLYTMYLSLISVHTLLWDVIRPNRSTPPLSPAASLFLFNFVCPSTNFAKYKIDYAILQQCTQKSIFTQYFVSHVTRFTVQSREETNSFSQCSNRAKLLRYTVFVSKRILISRYEANFCIYYLIDFIDLFLRYIWYKS